MPTPPRVIPIPWSDHDSVEIRVADNTQKARSLLKKLARRPNTNQITAIVYKEKRHIAQVGISKAGTQYYTKLFETKPSNKNASEWLRRRLVSKHSTKGNKGTIVLLDFEKAYDRVNREWLWDVLKDLGFGENFVS
eukprot:Phypoly_transcript_09240.p2 GENE.Phypoly_transcript_09240~~Phypoly_transcript_09240.p2  ORF type:complete len:136 (-),score=12.52 Phypoly_transcript_09240:582-989(-)